MAETSSIEWTDATWQPITGCSVVSPGCTNCYAMGLAGTRLRNLPSRVGLTRPSKAGPVWTGEVHVNEAWLLEPLKWRRPRKIFVCAHGDLFHEAVPDEWIDRVFAVMALYEVLYLPSDYPTKMFPSRCQHEPQFKMVVNCEIVRGKRGNRLELDHVLCLACGRSLPATHGGNVLVDVQMLLSDMGSRHWKFAQRLIAIRNKGARLATYLFDESGWTGRHESVARLIDPNLTMRLTFETDPSACGVRLGRISFDQSYLRATA